MKLYEFQGKNLLRKAGIAVPLGEVVYSAGDLPKLPTPAVFKAQVLTGGRGKAGGIVCWDGTDDPGSIVKRLLCQQIKGEATRAVLIEEMAQIKREFYLALTFRSTNPTILLLCSPYGGVDIEQIAKDSPESVQAIEINSMIGPCQYQARRAAKLLGYENWSEIASIIQKMYRVFVDCDASLVEINPLAETSAGLVALDTKVVLDSKASGRQKALIKELSGQVRATPDNGDGLEESTITYVQLSGTVGLISDGAGTGMLSLDLIQAAGGSAANFCELGGITNACIMFEAMDTVLANPLVRSLLVVLIGGFNRMDEMAAGIIQYHAERGITVPLVVRMCGTMEETGKKLMHQADIAVLYDDLVTAVQAAVSAAEERP